MGQEAERRPAGGRAAVGAAGGWCLRQEWRVAGVCASSRSEVPSGPRLTSRGRRQGEAGASSSAPEAAD